MDFDQLQKQWNALDRALDATLKLDVQAARAATLKRSRGALGWHRGAAWFELLASLPIAAGLGLFIAHHGDAWRFAVPALALLGWTLYSIVFNARHLAALARLDYAAPTAEIAGRLRVQHRARVHYAKCLLAACAVLWVCWVVVVLKAWFGIDAYAGRTAVAIWSLEAICVLGVLGMVVAGKVAPPRPEVRQRLADRLAGYGISTALAQLEDLDGPGDEPASEPPRLGRFLARVLGFVALLVLFALGVAALIYAVR